MKTYSTTELMEGGERVPAVFMLDFNKMSTSICTKTEKTKTCATLPCTKLTQEKIICKITHTKGVYTDEGDGKRIFEELNAFANLYLRSKYCRNT
ncbi:MAG: hypothetical protein IKK91_05450, partial [Ruminococcus sp.]|nr:hypothetical protein [Ruminococcus sp.]